MLRGHDTGASLTGLVTGWLGGVGMAGGTVCHCTHLTAAPSLINTLRSQYSGLLPIILGVH